MIIINISVFISGRGTNLQSIIDAVESGELPVEIKVVHSNNRDAYGLERARKAGIHTEFIDPEQFPEERKYEEQVLQIMKDNKIELIALAGYMRLISSYFLHNFQGDIMNIHPSLLPSFKGLHAQQQAIDYGVKISGCTVHFVDEGMDTGPIILQESVPVYDDDDEDALASRILEKEHQIYPEAIKHYAQGKLKLEGRKVIRMD